HRDGDVAAAPPARLLERVRHPPVLAPGGARDADALPAPGARTPGDARLLPLHRGVERLPRPQTLPVPQRLSRRSAPAHRLGADEHRVLPLRSRAQAPRPGAARRRVPHDAVDPGRRRRPARPHDLRGVLPPVPRAGRLRAHPSAHRARAAARPRLPPAPRAFRTPCRDPAQPRGARRARTARGAAAHRKDPLMTAPRTATSPHTGVVLREAADGDVPELVDLVQAAYRGEGGWTTEAHLVDGHRTDAAEVRAMLA